MDTEYPRKYDLRKDVASPLPAVDPNFVGQASMSTGAATTVVRTNLEKLNQAVSLKDIEMLSNCFSSNHATWRDNVALTSHIRTFTSPRTVAAAFIETVSLRELASPIDIVGVAHFIKINPTLNFVSGEISFETKSPPLKCSGKVMFLPQREGEIRETPAWKIWILSTWIDKLVLFPENETLLRNPQTSFQDVDNIKTDVLIVGGGSSGLIISARLKALGVESVVLERNAHIGDNWMLRYDSMTFHVPTSNCEMPYLGFPKDLHSPHRLTKYDLTRHFQDYAAKLNLNVITSAAIQTSTYSVSERIWTVRFKSGPNDLLKTVVAKHLIQATGISSGKPHLPLIEDRDLYKGMSLHSVDYRNAQQLLDRGVKSAAIIGSANTAFDVIEDCFNAGLKTTMVARSPTVVFPYEHMMAPQSIGAYDLMPVSAADGIFNTLPASIDGQLGRGLFAHLISHEPSRYERLAQYGFPVIDSRDPSFNIQHNLLERGGGHYIDVGGTKLISEGKVAVRGLVEPVGYTEVGLRLSDGSTLDADAVIWCTGFDDKNVRDTARDVLGANLTDVDDQGDTLSPTEIAARLDASWGVDSEGEVRGMWKRHLRMNNYWVMGGTMQHQRWWSRSLAQQIKLELEGCLPPAYRDTPAGY